MTDKLYVSDAQKIYKNLIEKIDVEAIAVYLAEENCPEVILSYHKDGLFEGG